MPTVGLDCQIILDSVGYWIEPESFQLKRPRVRRADLTRQPATAHLGAGERYIDQGPGKREWSFTVLAWQAMADYAGNPAAATGQSYRDSLHLSYEKVNTPLLFTDPAGNLWSVRFDDLIEDLVTARAQPDGELQYFLTVTLVEA